MQIEELNLNLKQITEDGLDIEESISAERFDINFKNFIATGFVNINLNVIIVSNEIIIQGTISAEYKSECDRCLNEVNFPVEINNAVLNYEYNNEDFLNIAPEIRDEIITNLPTKVVCNPDCKGYCYVCKSNLNIEPCKCEKNLDINTPFKNLI